MPACGGAKERPADLPLSAPGPYRLGPGDELKVNVFGLDAINGSYLIDDTGTVALPMLAPVKVGDRTVRQAEAEIAAAIRARALVLAPTVSAQVQAYRPFFIVGEVQRPGAYPFIPGMSLTTAVSIAGGYTFRANTKAAIVTRARSSGRARPETPIMPGDTITIRESWF